MPITTHFTPLAEVSADWLIIGLYEGEDLPPEVVQFDAQLGGPIGRLKRKKYTDGPGSPTLARRPRLRNQWPPAPAPSGVNSAR